MKTKSITITKVNDDSVSSVTQDKIVNESPLQIIVEYGNVNNRQTEDLSVTMRTQGDDYNLVRGFLFCEGIIKKSSDIVSIKHATPANILDEDTVLVELSPEILFNPNDKKRNFIASSACGFCGKSINDIESQTISSINSDIKIYASVLYDLPASLKSSQGLFSETGGAHAVALVNAKGEIINISEDVGRHNALDKLIGWGLLNQQLPFHDKVLMVSGRASYELLQKCYVAGAPIFCAVSAPSSLAVEVAERFGITLIGFLRGNRFNIYTGIERIAH